MTLCPGYKQVDEFDGENEYESEETVYVTLDLGNIEPTLVPTSTEYRLIGLDTPTPFLQLSGTVFKGQHDSLLGTELLFTEAKDGQDRNKKYVAPLATTEHRIRFSEVGLIPKNATPQGIASTSREADQDQVMDPKSSRELEVLTGLRQQQTRRKIKTPKEKHKKAKKTKRVDSHGAQQPENEGTSSRPEEAMDII